jgi:hypothetical protein
MSRLFVPALLLGSVVLTDAALAIPAGRFREHAEKVTRQVERRAGARHKAEETIAQDKVRLEIDHAKAKYPKAVAAADAAALKAIQRHLAATSKHGDAPQVKLIEQAKSDFESSKTFEAHDVLLLQQTRQQWLKAREQAARTVLSAYDRGIKSYTKSKRVADADGLRRERDAFTRDNRLPPAGLPAGAVLYLTFEPDTITQPAAGQTLAADLSGSHQPVSLQNIDLTADGHPGSAARFNGSTSSIDCGPAAASRSFATGLTIAAYVRIDSPAAAAPLLSRAGPKDAADFSLYLSDSRPTFALTLADGAKAEVQTPKPLTAGEWHHVVATFDGRQVRLFVDGKIVATKPAKGKPAASGKPVILGVGDKAAGLPLAGSMDGVTVFERALAPSEVGAIVDSK